MALVSAYYNNSLLYEVSASQIHPSEEIPDDAESFHNSLFGVADDVLLQVIGNNLSPDRLTQEEKMRIVDALDHKGVFLLKGAVGYVAGKLCCSQASIYRYLSKINRDRQQ